MKRIIVMNILFLCIAIVSGCQEASEQHEATQSDTSEVKSPKVEIIAKEHVDLHEKEEISANVYYGEDLVDDAEVTFEIKKGEEESEKVLAQLTDTGTYTIQHIFIESGTYQVTAHTNVKGYHTMPTINIQVGESSEISPEDDGSSTMDNEHENHHNHALSISKEELTNFKANQEELLSTQLKQKNEPFTAARVRFEIWKDGEEHHQYIDAEEQATKGTYTASYVFETTGHYHIVIHVEKEEIHEHVETLVEI